VNYVTQALIDSNTKTSQRTHVIDITQTLKDPNTSTQVTCSAKVHTAILVNLTCKIQNINNNFYVFVGLLIHLSYVVLAFVHNILSFVAWLLAVHEF
jgi:uncharacterized Tic20 family protein